MNQNHHHVFYTQTALKIRLISTRLQAQAINIERSALGLPFQEPLCRLSFAEIRSFGQILDAMEPGSASPDRVALKKRVSAEGELAAPRIENPITGKHTNPHGASLSAVLLAAGTYGYGSNKAKSISRGTTKDTARRLPRIQSADDEVSVSPAQSSTGGNPSPPRSSLSPITQTDTYKPSPLKREGARGSAADASVARDGRPQTSSMLPLSMIAPPLQMSSPLLPVTARDASIRSMIAEADASASASLDRTLRRIVALESSRLSLSEQACYV